MNESKGRSPPRPPASDLFEDDPRIPVRCIIIGEDGSREEVVAVLPLSRVLKQLEVRE